MPMPAAALLFLILALFLAMAGGFAAAQAIWVDETTQLSGLALGFAEQLQWLLHRSDLELGVPLDRMPPLSYWLGSLWAAVFGLSETSMRAFGITAMLAAAPALFLAGRRAGGVTGGLFALAFVLLAPNMLVQAVEIRAYPLFLTFCAWGVWCFAQLVIAPEGTPPGGTRWGVVAALAFCVLLASYTHFYGLVFGAFLFAALLLNQWLLREPVWPLFAIGGVTVLLALGILPFAASAVDLSSPPPDAASAAQEARVSLSETVRNTVRLALRTLLHSSHFVYPVLAGALVLAGLVLAGLGLAGASSVRARRDWIVMIFPVLAAFPVLAGLALMTSGFDVLAVHYNIWMVPIIAVWLCLALATDAARWSRQIAAGAALLAVVGQMSGAAVLLRHAPLFTHGPGEWVAGAIADPDTTLLIHDGRGRVGHVYFPVYFLTAGRATQIVVHPEAPPQQLTTRGRVPLNTDMETFFRDFETFFYVSARLRDTRFLAQHIRDGRSCEIGAMPDTPDLTTSEAAQTYCAFTAATLSPMRLVQQ